MKKWFYLLNFGAAVAQEELCAAPSEIENGSFTREHNSASYTCNVGYCFDNERTRTLNSDCQNGVWGSVPECVSCEKCDLPTSDANMEAEWIVGSWDVKLTCKNGVIKPGTDETEMVVSCIQGRSFNYEIPTCSRRPIVNCEDSYMEAIIDKNMLRAKSWAGTTENIYLSGPNSLNLPLAAIDPECFSVEDQNGNYILRVEAPFLDKCGTVSTIEEKNYVFSNQVIWKFENMMTSMSAHLLDFKCSYKGVFMAGLPHKVKLAINTKQYTDEMSGRSFTVSMSVYDKADFSGLVDNVPILHRGKRYFVDLHLHNKVMGTPYLKHCYGSNNYIAELELKQTYGVTSSSIKDMVVNGCPAPRTLVNLEESPSSFQSRFSFMFPQKGRGIAGLQFVYLHCEIEVREEGFKPICDDNLFDQALKRNLGLKRGQGGEGPLGVGARGLQSTERQNMCRLPWMRGTKICTSRRRRSPDVASEFAVGFGPLVVPNDDEEEGDERPSMEKLSSYLEDSNVYVTEDIVDRKAEVIRTTAVERLDESDHDEGVTQIETIEKEMNTRKIIIVSIMGGGGFLLFLISALITSRASCCHGVVCKKTKKIKKNTTISTDALAGQIAKELAAPNV